MDGFSLEERHSYIHLDLACFSTAVVSVHVIVV